MQTLTAAQTIDLAQLSRDLFSQVASVNATYLSLSVSIILGSGLLISVLMYFLNFKPMKEGLEKQAADIDKIKKETETKVEDLSKSQDNVSDSLKNLQEENKKILENLKEVSTHQIEEIKVLFEEKQKTFDERIKSEIESKLKVVDIKISHLERTAIEKIRALDIATTWDSHYMWEGKGVAVNALSSLLSTLEKTIDSLKTSDQNAYYIPLALKNLPRIIDKVIMGNPKLFDSLGVTITRLETCLSLIKDHESDKAIVREKLNSLKIALI